ncbi:hypothetical protein EXIGLDRAFT_728624 [Exidia glandulosa HHB12029]|uniref:F-box domain-containing protein n=1 Tax=Exidia glandulosa HHB12029 TaxID=1314781 RepID=A0A165Q5H7_EXIGL|nr:hypothetical protein EXIGLDRAFT_728624 [Exidia glandulosa HHB12029]
MPMPGGHNAANLPPELLCSVFVYLGFVDRITSTHVCHRWRDASLGSRGLLWSTVTSSGLRLGMLEQVFVRSGTTPVDVRLKVGFHNASEVATALERHICHCKTLRLTFKPGISDEDEEDLARSMSVAAPILDRLHLEGTMDWISRGFLGNTSMFLGAYAPRLTSFSYSGPLAELHEVPALRGVRHFVHRQSAPLDVEDLLAVSSYSPSLVDVALNFRYWSHTPPVFIARFPPNIGSVTFTASLGIASRLAEMFASIDVSTLPLLNVSFGGEFLTSGASEELITLCPHRLEVYSEYHTDAEEILAGVAFIGRDGRTVEFFNIPPSLPHATVAQVTVIEISEATWNTAGPWPPSPQLQELIVTLVAPAYYDAAHDAGMFVDVQRDIVLHCPALQTLAISTRRPGGSNAQWQRIPLLRLCGLRLLTHPIDDLAILLDMFEDVEMAPGHVGPPLRPIEVLLDL